MKPVTLPQAASSSSCRAAPQDRAPSQALGVHHWASLHCPSDHSHYLTVLVCLGVTGGFSTCESSFIQWHRLLFLPFFLSLVCCKFLFSRQSAFSILSWLSDISHLHVFSLQPSHFVCAYWQFHTQLTGNKQHHYHTVWFPSYRNCVFFVLLELCFLSISQVQKLLWYENAHFQISM